MRLPDVSMYNLRMPWLTDPKFVKKACYAAAMRPFEGRTLRRDSGRLTRRGRKLLTVVAAACILATALQLWLWYRSITMTPAYSLKESVASKGERQQALLELYQDRQAAATTTQLLPLVALPPWAGLLRASQAVELELWLDGNSDVGSCYEGKNTLSSTEHAHCAPLTCLFSTLAGYKVDLSVDLLTPLSEAAYPADCSSPFGGQKPLALSNMARQLNGSDSAAAKNPPLVQVSFIVTIHNSIIIAARCLMELFRTAREAHSVEYVVVDDGSTEDTAVLDGVVLRLQALFGVRVILIRNAEAEGYGAANMRGIQAASGQYLAIINSDLFPAPGWLWTLLHTFRDRPKAALVGPLFLGANHLVMEAGGAVWADGSAGNYGRGEEPAGHLLYARNVDYVSAACVLVRRSAFLSVGGFDPAYGKGFYEDTDLAMALAAAGHHVVYQPLSVVYHQEGTSLGDDHSITKQVLMRQNRKIFRKKWADRLAATHCPHGFPLDQAARRQQLPRLLWIEDLVPEPDHDSGSVRAVQMLKILMRQGFGVALQSTGDARTPEGLHTRPARYVAQARFYGAEVLPALLHGQSPAQWLEWMGGARQDGCPYDVIMVSRGYIFEKWAAVLAAWCPGTQVLFDTVDLNFLREARERMSMEGSAGAANDFERMHCASVIKLIDGLDAGEALRMKRDAELRYVDQCAVTLVVSKDELAVLQHYRPQGKFFLVSNILELKELETGCEGRNGVLFVANFQHVPNLRAVEFLIKDILPATLRVLPPAVAAAFVVHIVGANTVPPEIRQLMSAAPQVMFHGYMTEEQLRLMHFKVKAVVAPLLSGAGVKGKVNAALKMRVPVVVTPVAAEGMYLTHGVNALVASTGEAFGRAIASVVLDCELWQRLASAGFETMLTHFSIEVAEKQLAAAYAAAGSVPPLAPALAQCIPPLPPPPLLA